LAAGFLVIAVPTCLLTFSRGGYLGLLAIAVGLALSHRRRLVLVAATLIAALAASRVPPIASRLGHEVDLADPNNSLVERGRLWGATLRMLRDHPLFGGGLSGFKQAIAPYGVQQSAAEDVMYPHNIVLNAWTETGLLGLMAFGWVLVQAVRVAITGWREAEPTWRPLYAGVILAIAAMVVHGLVDVPYWKNDLSVEFWALLALAWAGLRRRGVAPRHG
jgi:O-antigen ligase